jgi:hypothetical protein
VGDDACLILWDARTGTDPAVKVTFFCSTSNWIKYDFGQSSVHECNMPCFLITVKVMY